MPSVSAAADLVIFRAGSSTLSELSLLRKPAILVPYPNVTNNHQLHHAQVLAKAGGAVVMEEGSFTQDSLFGALSELLLSPERMDEMSKAMKSCGISDATDRITDIILGIANH